MPPYDIIDMITVYQVMEFPATKNWPESRQILVRFRVGCYNGKKGIYADIGSEWPL